MLISRPSLPSTHSQCSTSNIASLISRKHPHNNPPTQRTQVPSPDSDASSSDRSEAEHFARRAANDELLKAESTAGDANMLPSLVQLAELYSTILSSLSSIRFSKHDEVDVAAKELAMRRLLPPPAKKQAVAGQGVAQQAAGGGGQKGGSPDQQGGQRMSALVGFLTTLFFDSVLRQAEGWDPSQYVTASTTDTLARQGAVGAIKGVLGSFCVLDEERRFELFHSCAELESRWRVDLSPAMMHAITDTTEVRERVNSLHLRCI